MEVGSLDAVKDSTRRVRPAAILAEIGGVARALHGSGVQNAAVLCIRRLDR